MTEPSDGQTTQDLEAPTVPEELQDKDLGSGGDVQEADHEDAEVVSVPEPSSEQLPAWADHTHEYVRHYIALADQKAAFVFTASTAMLAYLYGQGALALWQSGLGEWGLWSVVAGGSTLLLGVAALCAGVAVWPRLAGKTDGLVYWKAVAAHSSADEYYGNVRACSDEDLARERLAHTFELARVCDRKYRWVSGSIRASIIGFGAAVLLILSGAI
jgi:hypothetical protein